MVLQGQEKDIIILSTTVTRSSAFAANNQRLNVALTRARHHLLLVGHALALEGSCPALMATVGKCRQTPHAYRLDGRLLLSRPQSARQHQAESEAVVDADGKAKTLPCVGVDSVQHILVQCSADSGAGFAGHSLTPCSAQPTAASQSPASTSEIQASSLEATVPSAKASSLQEAPTIVCASPTSVAQVGEQKQAENVMPADNDLPFGVEIDT